MLWIDYQRLDHRGDWERIPTFGSVTRFDAVNGMFVEIDELGDFYVYIDLWDEDADPNIYMGILHRDDIKIQMKRLGWDDSDAYEFFGESIRHPGTIVIKGMIKPL